VGRSGGSKYVPYVVFPYRPRKEAQILSVASTIGELRFSEKKRGDRTGWLFGLRWIWEKRTHPSGRGYDGSGGAMSPWCPVPIEGRPIA